MLGPGRVFTPGGGRRGVAASHGDKSRTASVQRERETDEVSGRCCIEEALGEGKVLCVH